MKEFNFRNRNLLTGPHVLGPLFILAGFVALVSTAIFYDEETVTRNLLVGGGALVLGIFIIKSYEGTLIDLTKKSVYAYLSIAGYKMGKWKALPDISVVKVVSNSYVRTNVPNGISPTFSGKVTEFKLLLYSADSNPELTFVYAKRKKAIKQATKLATHLNAALLLEL